MLKDSVKLGSVMKGTWLLNYIETIVINICSIYTKLLQISFEDVVKGNQ